MHALEHAKEQMTWDRRTEKRSNGDKKVGNKDAQIVE